MAMIEINKNPSRAELLWFGALLPAFFALVGGLVYWQFAVPTVATALWIAGASVTLLYWIIPPARTPFYVAWMVAAFPIGWILSHVVLGVVYYLVMTPIGLALRIVGFDPLSREFDSAADSYWVPHKPAEDSARYFRQF